MTPGLPVLVAKALTDNGYDVVAPADDGWTSASISGSGSHILVKRVGVATLIALHERDMGRSIGLEVADLPPPAGMHDIGRAEGPRRLYESLRLLRSLQTHPASVLSARLEQRLAAIPLTERTQEVRQRIGQDLFREALFDLWGGRCALSGLALHPALLRASHAKPWADSSDQERLDPFNGLLLAVQYDAVFDRGLIAFDDSGSVLARPELSPETMALLRIEPGMRLRGMLPGHVPYLRVHRVHVARLP